MFKKPFAGLSLVVVSMIMMHTRLDAESPFAHDGKVESDTFDPFAERPLIDRFQWREFLSIKQTLVSGRDVVSALSRTTVTLASGDVFMTDDDTVIVRQSPGQPPSPASRNDISVGTPISYEIDMEHGPAARRIVVWQGFGPHGHKIYDDKITALIKPLRNRGISQHQFKLDCPEQPMMIAYASSKRVIAPGEPQLIQFEEPQMMVDVFCGKQRKTVSVDKEFSAVVVFRSYGNRGMLLLVE